MNPFPRTCAPFALALTLTAGLSACGADDTTGPTATASASPNAAAVASGAVSAEDQTGDGKTLTVARVDLEGVDQGFIGVHMDLDGKPGPVVGVAPVKSGSTDELVVRFDEPVTTGAFWPMLHVDDSVLGTYEFPEVEGADLPVMDGDAIVMKKVTLTVG